MLKYRIPDNIGLHGFADDHTHKDSFKPAIDQMDKIIGLAECLGVSKSGWTQTDLK